MASVRRRLAANVAGDVFVDDTCIDCGACRWIAPATFDAHDGYARVHRQPVDGEDTTRALQALVSCPSGSIGTERRHALGTITATFPRPVAADVFHCGYHSEKSFGAASYLIVRPEGNVLVDSPRFNRGLLERIAALGEVRWMFLTHADDVADHVRFARRLGCERVLHSDDVRPGTREVERLIQGAEPVQLAPDLTMIPTPGHTRGSMCLLFRNEVLFTGDHLAFSRALGHLHAFSGACWFDWDTQIRSMERLATFTFRQILPGHGAPCRFDVPEMQRQMRQCITWMRGRTTRRRG